MEKDIVNIGKSVVIKGELNGSEDLTIEGHVEGTIRAARARADDRPERQDQGAGVREVGDRARRGHRQRHRERKVDIRDNGSVDGDIISPRVAIAEGAHFRGSVDMQRKGGAHRRPARQAGSAATPQAQAARVAAAASRAGQRVGSATGVAEGGMSPSAS